MERIMGAVTFITNPIKAKTAKAAFKSAREEAILSYGNSGYTGTIAEKDCFEVVKFTKKQLANFHENISKEIDKNFDDKWGPAGCVEVKKGEFVFFGWASC